MTRKVPKAVRAWAIKTARGSFAMRPIKIPWLYRNEIDAEIDRQPGERVIPVLIQPIARKSGGRRK